MSMAEQNRQSGSASDQREQSSSVKEQIKDSASALSERASSAAEAVGERASKASHKVTGMANAASEELATQIASEASSMAEEAIGTRKRRAEHYIGAVGSAIEAGSQSLEKDGLHQTAEYAREAAKYVDGFASQVDRIDISSATGRVEEFMRTRPVVSFGAALLLGFTAYQLLKSRNRPEQGAGKGH
jgi:hypothetical protein